MKFCFASALIAMIASLGIAHAQTWTTPDGFLSVTPPDPETFVAIPSPPEPFLGLWISKDETTKLGVMKTQIPTNIKLNQSLVEEGLAEEIDGEATRLPTKMVAGYEVWQMKANAKSAELIQAIVRHDGTIYKIMAATVGANPDKQTIDQFIGSLEFSRPARMTTPGISTSPGKSNTDVDGGLDPNELSKSIGGFAALLGIGLLIYFVTRGKNK